MIVARWKPVAFALGILFAMVVVTLLTTQAQGQVDEPTAVFGHNQVTVGNTIALPLTFDSLPNGLSGYQAKITVSDPAKLGITGYTIDAQERAELTVATFFPPVQQLTLAYVDFADVWKVGATYPPFLRIDVEGIEAGNVNVAIEWMAADDNLGNPLNLPSQATLVLVTDPVPP